MKLSIIVPVYNGHDDIERCLQSLIAQSEKVKIIVVDDGSIDDTKELVLALKSKYPELIDYYYKENGGIASARNFGLTKVKTPYFGFLDSDDLVSADMAKEMLAAIEEKDADICFSDFNWVYPDKRKYQKDTGYTDKKDILVRMFATLWNKIYRTDFIRGLDIDFPDGLRYEDASFLYRLAIYMDKVAYVDKAYVDYIQKSGSITHTFSDFINDMIEVFKGIDAYYKKQGKYDEYRAELEYLHVRFFLGNSYLRACRIKDRQMRNMILERSWNYLNESYPNYKNNPYLQNGSKKDRYFKTINHFLYRCNVYLFRLLYKLKIMR